MLNIRGIKLFHKSSDIYSCKLKEALDQIILEKNLEQGYCKVCKNETSHFCSQCGTHYCNIMCQKSDWPNHKAMCKTNIVFSSWINNAPSQAITASNSNMKNECGYSPRVNLDMSKKDLYVNDRCITFENESGTNSYHTTNRKLWHQSEIEEEIKMKEGQVKAINTKMDPKHKGLYCSVDRELMGKSGCSGVVKTAKELTEEDFARLENSEDESENELAKYLPMAIISTLYGNLSSFAPVFKFGQTISVICTWWQSGNILWAIEEKNRETLEHLQQLLSEKCEYFENIQPTEGCIYGFSFMGKWYRGQIVRTTPKVRVQCVDTGKVFYHDLRNVKNLSPDLNRVKRMAFPIEFIDKSHGKQSRNMCPFKIVVEVINNENGVYIVKIPDKNQIIKVEDYTLLQGQDTVLHSQEIRQSRRCVFDYLEVGTRGFFTPFHVRNYMLGSLIIENIEDVSHCYEKISSLHSMGDDTITADVGDLVMVVNRENLGQRGIVKSKSNEYGFRVYLIDCGYTVDTLKVHKLPKNVENLVDLSCKVSIRGEQFQSLSDEFEVSSPYDFEVKMKIEKGKWLCSLKKGCSADSLAVETIIEKINDDLVPREECVPLESGCKVVITHLNSNGSLYVRRVDEKWDNLFHDIILKINTQSPPDGNDDYNVGDLVSCKYKPDDIFYRAKILSKHLNKYQVVFVDYGNEQLSDVKDLKSLPPTIQDIPILVRQVTLRCQDSDNSFSSSAEDYLKKYIDNAKELVLIYENDISQGIYLKEPGSNISINQRLYCHQLDPEKCMEEFDEFTTNFLRSPRLPAGDVRSLDILYVEETEFLNTGLFWAANPNTENPILLLSTMTYDITNYCLSSPKNYTPRVNELCLACFEDAWYRGLTIKCDSNAVEIFFLDFGNKYILKPESICEMLPRFFREPPVALKCIYQGFDRLTDKERRDAYQFLSDKVMTNVNISAVSVKHDFCYVTFYEAN